MASAAQHGPLRAEQVLPLHSEQEALNLGEVEVVPERIHRVATATSYNQHNTAVLAWRRHISLSVPHNKCRDHLANERTALGYIRTAQAFAMLGVVIAQVMRLNASSSPDPVLGFLVVSVPLSAICHVMALVITCLGFYRFLHWQAELARGRALSGGWEMMTIFVLSILVLLSIVVLVVSISIRRDDS